MDAASYAATNTRQMQAQAQANGGGGGGGGEAEAEMQHMLQFLDASLVSPPSASTSPGDGRQQQQQQQQSPPPHQSLQQPHPQPQAARAAEELHEASVLTEDDNGMYTELGDVFNLFFNLDTGDSSDPMVQQQHLAFQQQQQQRYNERGRSSSGGRSLGPSPATAGDAAQRVQLPRSTSVSSSQGGSDSISPVGLLNGYPSMSPATINWLQSLVPSASSESLSGLISPATLYSASGGSGMGSVGSLGGPTGSAGGAVPGETSGAGAKNGSMPRSPSCEMIDWKAYNDACGAVEKTQKEPAKWRVIPQHGPHADPAVNTSVASSTGVNTVQSFSRPPPGATASASDFVAGGGMLPSSSTPADAVEQEMQMSDTLTAEGVHESTNEDGGLRTHLSRQYETIKSTVVSLVGALSAPASPSSDNTSASQLQPQQQQQPFDYAAPAATSEQASGAPSASVSGLTAQQQMRIQLAAKKMTDEKNKRKAVVSPEYVQYANPASLPASVSESAPASAPTSEEHVNTVKVEPVQFATKVPEPTGRRPFKKTLHKISVPVATSQPQQHQHQQNHQQTTAPSALSVDSKDDGVRCKCTGKCRNARCACVKGGLVCGAHCKCVSCANPFVPMAREGIDIQLMVRDVCLMQYLSKVKDMQELLDSTVSYECCEGGGVVQVKHTVEHGFACPHCGAHFTYSWCNNRLCPDAKKPRRHCAKCRRCGDHRNQHCDLCNHCYFAGVANSFRCSCQSTGGKASGPSGVKTRAVVPNPVHRNAATGVGKQSSGEQSSHEQQHPYGGGGPATEGGTTRDENSDASNGATAAGIDGEDDSCKMQ